MALDYIIRVPPVLEFHPRISIASHDRNFPRSAILCPIASFLLLITRRSVTTPITRAINWPLKLSEYASWILFQEIVSSVPMMISTITKNLMTLSNCLSKLLYKSKILVQNPVQLLSEWGSSFVKRFLNVSLSQSVRAPWSIAMKTT